MVANGYLVMPDDWTRFESEGRTREGGEGIDVSL